MFGKLLDLLCCESLVGSKPLVCLWLRCNLFCTHCWDSCYCDIHWMSLHNWIAQKIICKNSWKKIQIWSSNVPLMVVSWTSQIGWVTGAPNSLSCVVWSISDQSNPRLKVRSPWSKVPLMQPVLNQNISSMFQLKRRNKCIFHNQKIRTIWDINAEGAWDSGQLPKWTFDWFIELYWTDLLFLITTLG